MADPLFESLEGYKERAGRPLRVLLVNTGGTFSCLPNKKGLLEPINNAKDLKRLVHHGLNMDILIKKELIEIKVLHLYAIDSSQMTDKEREDILRALHPEYVEFEGAIIMHGTDTAADTAKFLHLALPYYDPRAIWRDESRQFNWGKPVLVLSSQVPAIDAGIDNELTYRIDSDGPMNLSLALMVIADHYVGESGVITNNGTALRGTASEKGAEVDIPPFRTDPGVQALAKYTALGLRYLPQGYLQRITDLQAFVPFIIEGSSEFGERVVTVYDSSHLKQLKSFLDLDNTLKKKLRDTLPDVFIYVTKGAGNVMKEDYELLKKAEKEGMLAFRVPLPGGRIPDHQLYDVPGHDIPALNMQPQTAKYKAMMTLKLMKTLSVRDEKRKKFIQKMMKTAWANEFLPQR